VQKRGCGQKKTESTRTANSSNVLTDFAAEHNKDEVLEDKFRNLNFSPSSKKTTGYSFELFLLI